MSNPAKNDITGDPIKTKAPNETYRKGWDRIFENKGPKQTGETKQQQKNAK